jgi:hypothetical protein
MPQAVDGCDRGGGFDLSRHKHCSRAQVYTNAKPAQLLDISLQRHSAPAPCHPPVVADRSAAVAALLGAPITSFSIHCSVAVQGCSVVLHPLQRRCARLQRRSVPLAASLCKAAASFCTPCSVAVQGCSVVLYPLQHRCARLQCPCARLQCPCARLQRRSAPLRDCLKSPRGNFTINLSSCSADTRCLYQPGR